MNIPAIPPSPLFSGIDPESLPELLHCLGAYTRSYFKEDFLLRAGHPPAHVGVVLTGTVYVLHEDYWGNRHILSHMEPGALFGESFACDGAGMLPVSVMAADNADILWLDASKITGACPTACIFHSRLIRNLLGIVSQKNIALTQKLGHLSRRSIRGKLLSYLSSQVFGHSGTAELPFDRQALADYLCVDRSALSRELSAMKREGIIDYHQNHFKLLAQPGH